MFQGFFQLSQRNVPKVFSRWSMWGVMEFITLPPEVTSALIHSGPGAESLIEASGAWQRLATNLEESAGINVAALSSLTGAWHGPSSLAMTQAVEPYLTWLRTTAQQCQQIASSAQAAAAAFNSVRAAVVPPSQVSANRTRLAQLLATNQFGKNLAAIGETEAQYEGMWANNSAAMNRYEAASAQAATLPQFSSPPPIADPAGVGRSSQCGARRYHFCDARCHLSAVFDIGVDRKLRPPGRLVWAGEHLCEPVHIVRISDQHAQLSGPGHFGPGTPECGRRSWPGSVGGSGGPGSPGVRSVGCVRRRWTVSRTHGGDRCWSVFGQADRAARCGGAVARFASASPTRVGGIAASSGRLRVAHAPAFDAATDLGRQWLAQTEAAKVRRYCIWRGAQGDGDAPTAISGMSDPARQLASRRGAAG